MNIGPERKAYMKPYIEMTKTELESEIESLKGEYKKYQDKNLKLNMARGKPGSDQLELSMPMLDVLNSSSDCKDKTGLDCRNYGALDGIADAKELFSEYMGVSPDEIIVVGSSSLTFMYDCIARAMLKGVSNSDKPWCKYEEIKFICPVPGYDRHFSICEFLGIKMISVGMDENGPDMDTV